MSKSNAFETDILLHVFNNQPIANIGDASGLQPSGTAGSLYVALHTADPGEGGNASTNEAAYTGYARKAVARSSSGWTVSGNSASNAAVLSFQQCTAGSATCTHFSVGYEASGASKIAYSGALAQPLIVNPLITPTFDVGQIVVTED